MNIVVIGGGAIGCAQALELALDGHQVTLIDEHQATAVGATFASGGLSGPTHTGLGLQLAGLPPSPLSWPGVLSMPRAQMLRHPLWWHREQRRLSGAGLKSDQLALHQLALLGRERRDALLQRWRLDAEETRGLLWLWGSTKEGELGPALAEAWRAQGLCVEALSPDDCLATEPAADPQAARHGGLLFHGESGLNPRLLAQHLRQAAQSLGVQVLQHTRVTHIVPGTPLSLSLAPHRRARDEQDTRLLLTQGGEGGVPSMQTPSQWQGDTLIPQALQADAVVVCAGTAAADLLHPLGIKTGIRAIWGLSLTAAIREERLDLPRGPQASVWDVPNQMALSRIGQRVRVSGGAFFTPPDVRADGRDMAPLYAALHRVFPASAELATAQRWRAARAYREGGLPWIGASGVPGLWLNLGHGQHGLALANGAARLLADVMVQADKASDTAPWRALTPSQALPYAKLPSRPAARRAPTDAGEARPSAPVQTSTIAPPGT